MQQQKEMATRRKVEAHKKFMDDRLLRQQNRIEAKRNLHKKNNVNTKIQHTSLLHEILNNI